MFDKFLKYSGKAEEWFLGLMLLTMVVLACTQIVLRSVFSSGLLWIDPFLRYLVLWSGMVGAAMATTKGKHIALDVISYLAPPVIQNWLSLLTNLFSTAVSGGLTYAAFLFIRDEYQYGGPGLLELPTWFWNAIFPLAFFIITLRFGMQTIRSCTLIISGKDSQGSPK